MLLPTAMPYGVDHAGVGEVASVAGTSVVLSGGSYLPGEAALATDEATGWAPTVVLGVGGLALVGIGACLWQLSRLSFMSAEMEALVTLSIDWNDEDAAAVLEAARAVIESAAKHPRNIILAHVWPRVMQAWS